MTKTLRKCHQVEKSQGSAPTERRPLLLKSHTKGCDETPKKTGFESIHTFVILRFNK